MASIDTLLDFVMPKAPRLTVALARLEIRQAAIRFFRKSGADQRSLGVFDTIVGEPFYTLALPADTAISEIVSVVLDGEVPGLSPLRSGDIPADAETTLRFPEWYSASKAGGRLQLIYAPAAVHSVFVKASLEPSRSAILLDDDLAARYGEDIANGALEALLVMPKKPWTDQATASYYKAKFDSAVIDAREEVAEGFSPAPTRNRCTFGLR